MFYVYLIQNLINGKVYVGETNDPCTRWIQHQNTKPIKLSVISKAILKYGAEKFKFEVIEEFDSEKQAFEAEIWWIAYLKSLGAILYNLTEGGDGSHYWLNKFLPQEMKDKVSAGRIGKYGGINNPMYGKNHDIKVKLKISQANKKFSDEVVMQLIKLSQTESYTGRELSKIFNMSRAQVSRIINGKRRNL